MKKACVLGITLVIAQLGAFASRGFDSATLACQRTTSRVNPAPDINHPILEYEERHREPITAMAFSPDGSTLALATRNYQLLLCDAKSGKEIRTLSAAVKRALDYVDPDGQRVISLAFSDDGAAVAAAGDVIKNARLDGSEVRLWDLKTGKVARTISIGRSWGTYARFVSFLRKRSVLLTAAEVNGNGQPYSEIVEWNTRTGQVARTWPPIKNRCESVAVSPDERTLAVGFHGGIALWDKATAELRSILPDQNVNPSTLCYTPDGLMIVGNYALPSAFEGSDEFAKQILEFSKAIHFWDASGHYLAQMRVQQPGPVSTLAISPDGMHMAVADQSGTFRYYRIK